jgi:predicted polyphosphate/ATP-dependent NAD kinase
VAHGSVFDNNEKTNIVRRVILGLDAVGVGEVLLMPDGFGIGRRALKHIQPKLEVEFLDMRARFDQTDSTRAAKAMREAGVGCIVTLGGDGTNRVVAKGCGDVPLVPISTGTNNVFPVMIEGTIAGLAAGLVAAGLVDVDQVVRQTLRLEVCRDDQVVDIALVDVAVYDDLFVASRAIWDMSKVRAVVLTRAEPGNIGLSSIGGNLRARPANGRQGLFLRMGDDGQQVLAAVAPGLVRRVRIAEHRLLSPGDTVPVTDRPSILALDGEREIRVHASDEFYVRLSLKGPRVVDVPEALVAAAASGFFLGDPPTRIE